MHRQHRAGWLWLAVVCCCAVAFGADRQPSAAYVDGIEALDAGQFKLAVEKLTQALATDEENADYLRARGVANTLAEQFRAALADLQRALRLNGNDREAKLWLAAAFRMSGDVATGSQNFGFHSSVPKEYTDLVYNLMAMEYWQSREAGARVKKRFTEAAHLYAQRHLATGPAANTLIVARMKAALDRADWTAAMKDLRTLRRTAPDDAALRGDWARCLLGLGDAWHAREEFTRVLCIQPEWAAGYAGRAQAAAILGDPRRVAADIETATSLGKTATVADAKPDEALAVHRQFNARRLRYDELYQDRIWALTDARRNDAKNAAWPEGLARFLYNHHVVPTVWNGPRAIEQLRPQSKVEHAQELQRALDTADVALRLDKRNVNAIATKAWVFLTLGNVGEAERLADQGLGIERRNVRLLRLKEKILLDRAASMEAEARALRAGHTETHTEQRSDGTYRVTTHRPATAAELAQAAALEAAAATYRREASQLRAEAAKVESEMIPKLIKARAFDEAARCDPDRVDVLKGQASQANRRGAKAYALLATPLEHTTAAPTLKTAWEHTIRTAWKSAGEALDAAAQIDPTDTRVPAYRAIVATGRGDTATAARERRGAVALEEAKAKLMGGDAAPVRVDDVALVMAVRIQQASLESALINAQIEARFDKLALIEFAPTALLPDPTSDPNKVPESPTLASLLAWSHLVAGRALLASGKPSEALDRYRMVIAYERNWPATAEGRETLTLPCGWAQLGLVEAAIAAKDYDGAMKMVMDQHIVAWGLPRELEQRRKALQEQIRKAREQEYEQQREADARMTPRQMKMRSLQNDLAQFQQQRDSAARELERTDVSDGDKAVLRRSMEELDRMIATYKASLKRLEESPDEPVGQPAQGRRR